MSAAEFHCEACRKPIGARRSHWIIAGHVFCARCTATAAAHSIAFPECSTASHDAHDHAGNVSATLAAARRILTREAVTS